MLELKNQFILAPIKLGYSKDGKINQRHLNFYEERGEHLGAVTPEPFFLDKGLREIPTQLGIDNDDKIPGLQKLTALLHEQGTKVIAHLNHPGRMANPKIPGNYHVSSTDKACENGGATPEKLDTKGMQGVVNLFTKAAKRAEKADFDFVELQFGHGYLLAQFLSPQVNDRDDQYGGNFENRIKFPIQVLEAVKNSVDIPVIARLSGDEMIDDGIRLKDMVKFSKILANQGIEAIHVSAGTVCSTPPWYFQHMFVPKGKTWNMASEIKKFVDVPVIAVGKINASEDIQKIRYEGMADYMAIGRALLADPDFVGKYLQKVDGPFRPCLACSEGCLGGVKGGKGLHCVVNPRVGEILPEPELTEDKKKYAIVGGGLAGMEAALTLDTIGHDVVLYEKEKLGGQFNLAHLPPKKESLKRIIDYYREEIENRNIEVHCEEATREDLMNNGFSKIILATGAVPAVPPIEGLDEYYWADFLLEKNLPKDQRILIIGGGLIGIEMASKLTDNGNEVIIVEMLESVAEGMEMIEKALTMKKLKNNQVKILTNHRVVKIKNTTAELEVDEDEKIKTKKIENIDNIILAAGMKSYDPLSDELEDQIDYQFAGDAKRVGKAQDAIRSGYEVALSLRN
ncbi:MAG TPA: FAD-dependent oxidoreductase [bacterium]|nr:FAD-dependent oxidoreductase [bacterium]